MVRETQGVDRRVHNYYVEKYITTGLIPQIQRGFWEDYDQFTAKYIQQFQW